MNTTAVLDAGFAGSAAVVDVDGTVDRASFDAFADAVARATNVRAVGYAPIVADARPCRVRGAHRQPDHRDRAVRQLVPAATRPTYAPAAVDQPDGRAGGHRSSASTWRPMRRATQALEAARGLRRDRVLRTDPPPDRRRSWPCSSPRRCIGRGRSLDTVERSPGQRRRLHHRLGPERRDRRRDDRPGRLRTFACRSPTATTALGSTPQMPDGGHRMQVVGGGRPWVVTLQRPAPHHTNALLGAAATLLAAGAVGLALAAQPAQDAGVALQRPLGAGAGSAQRAPRRGRIARPDGRRDRHLCAGGGRRATRRRRARRSGAPRRTGAPRQRRRGHRRRVAPAARRPPHGHAR